MSRIKIELIAPDCNEVRERHYEGRDGKKRVARSQTGWLFNGDRFPTKIKVNIPDDRAPYAPGEYELSPENYQVDNFDNVKLNGFSTFLVPLAKG